jgi:ribosome-associated heat shock protein Hsp15
MAQKRDGDTDEHAEHVRLDKWLWAARFYKTRGLAVQAIEGGKVLSRGERTKPAHVVRLGDEMRIRLGPYEHVIEVRALNLRRGPATQAQLMYEETAESVAARARLAEQLKAASALNPRAAWSDSKKDRRDLRRMRGKH